MVKRHHEYQSPYAALLTNDRYAAATKLAQQTGKDQSQILFAYLQITAAVNQLNLGVTATLPEIDRRFHDFLVTPLV